MTHSAQLLPYQKPSSIKLAWAHSNVGVRPSEVCRPSETRLGALQPEALGRTPTLECAQARFVPGPERGWAHPTCSAQNAYFGCCVLAPLACSRPWRVRAPDVSRPPVARAQIFGSTLMPRWCAHAQMNCAWCTESQRRLGALQVVPVHYPVGKRLECAQASFTPSEVKNK